MDKVLEYEGCTTAGEAGKLKTSESKKQGVIDADGMCSFFKDESTEKYEFAGVVNIDQVLVNLFRKRVIEGKSFITSPYLRRILELHNEGLGPSGISARLRAEQNMSKNSTQPSKIREKLKELGVKPNETADTVRRKNKHKILDKEYFEEIVASAMGSGNGVYTTIRDSYGGLLKYDDNTSEIVSSMYIIKQAVDRSIKVYVK